MEVFLMWQHDSEDGWLLAKQAYEINDGTETYEDAFLQIKDRLNLQKICNDSPVLIGDEEFIMSPDNFIGAEWRNNNAVLSFKHNKEIEEIVFDQFEIFEVNLTS